MYWIKWHITKINFTYFSLLFFMWLAENLKLDMHLTLVLVLLTISGRDDLCTQQILQVGSHNSYSYQFPILQRLKLKIHFPQIPYSYCFGDDFVSLTWNMSRRIESQTKKERYTSLCWSRLWEKWQDLEITAVSVRPQLNRKRLWLWQNHQLPWWFISVV